MATTDDTATTDELPNSETFDRPIIISARGLAILERQFGDADSHGVVETETVVDITIPFETVDAVLDTFFNNGVQGWELSNGMDYAPNAEMRELIGAELSAMDCRIDDYDSWSVELDGPVTAWVRVFEQCEDSRGAAKALAMHDCIGDGVSLAAQEFDRRG